MLKLPWHKPRIVTVEAWGPLRSFVMYTLFDGRRIVVPQTPIVINSTDAERKLHKDDLNRKRVKKSNALKKARNPITNRIDPVAVFQPALPASVYKELDDDALKKLEENQRDVDATPITLEEARSLVIADIVKAEAKKRGR